MLGRFFAACTAKGYTPTLRDILGVQTLNDPTFEDWNNGPAISTDLPQSGEAWLAAKANLAAREAVIEDLRRYTQGYFYWLLKSGDPRIPAALIEQLGGYGLDATTFLDPCPGDPLFWPCQPYRRDPVFQMKNSFGFSAHDTFAPDGTAPRSPKTISVIAYRADRHTPRRVVHDDGTGSWVYRLGSIEGPQAGGSNRTAPLPLETIVPDKSECTNFLSVTAPAMTKVAWYSARMEACLCLAAQSAAIIADQALSEGSAVQDIDYGAFRARVLKVPDSVKPVLPLIN